MRNEVQHTQAFFGQAGSTKPKTSSVAVRVSFSVKLGSLLQALCVLTRKWVFYGSCDSSST